MTRPVNIDRLINGALAQHFDEATDLVRFVQSRTNKSDESILTKYWLGKKHKVKDKTTLAVYGTFGCNR